MNKFDIYVDSSANIPDAMLGERKINVISYSYIINGEEHNCWKKDVPFTETAKSFYDSLRCGAEIKTSLVGEQTITDAVTPSLEAGNDVLIMTIASGISGTYQQALAAKKTLEKQFPKRKVYVLDSANASLGEGLLVLKAADLRDMGESVESCAEWIEENKYKQNAYLTVGDLKYLRKGGRISATLAIAGTLLNIKPIIKADGGTPAKLTFTGRERGRKRALEALLKAFDENVLNPENQTVAIAHCNCEEDALKLAEAVKERSATDVIIEYYDLCTGAHVGPGTIALFFTGKDRRSAAAVADAKKRGKTAAQEI